MGVGEVYGPGTIHSLKKCLGVSPDLLYSSPPQLSYPQLRYFCSYAILNWVQKNSS